MFCICKSNLCMEYMLPPTPITLEGTRVGYENSFLLSISPCVMLEYVSLEIVNQEIYSYPSGNVVLVGSFSMYTSWSFKTKKYFTSIIFSAITENPLNHSTEIYQGFHAFLHFR